MKIMRKYLPVFLLMLLGVICRWLPHPANFAPIGAIALFGGMYLPSKWAAGLPLAAMFISDIFLGFYAWPIMLSVYVSFLLMVLIGKMVNKHKKFRTILGGTILGSCLFFVITNTAVWAFGTMYVHNLSGLLTSFAMAIPFFRNSLLGNMFYVGLLVGGMELITYIQYKKAAWQTVR